MSSLFGIAGGGNVGAAGGSFYSYSIDQSLRFDGSSSYLSKNDFGTATDTNIRTFSTWIKQSDLSFSTYDAIIGCASSGIQTLTYYSDNPIGFYNTQGGASYEDNSAAVFRDTGAWFHIFFTYSHTANEMKLYINGSLTKGFSTGTHGPLEKLAETGHITTLMKRSNASQYVGAYLAETVLLDGYVGDINDFAESKNGVWVPKNISAAGLTYGANGFYLNYADSSDLGKDVSGQDNHFTSNGLAAEDQVPDSPTNNFATYNPLVYSTATYAEGNLKFDAGGWSSSYWGSKSTFAIPKDKKIYIELEETATGGVNYAVGIATDSATPTGSNIGGTGSITLYHTEFKINGTSTAHGQGSSVAGDIIGIAVDGSTGEVWFSRNGTWFTTGGAGADPSTGTDPIGTVTNPNNEDLFLVVAGNTSTSNLFVNFGQDSTNVASAESDANGIGTFEYAVPTDHVCLCASSLSEPAISPNSTTSDEYFNTVLWTGNGVDNNDAQEINGLSFEPNFVWIKGRSGTQYHELHDSVRGAGKRLFSNETSAETDFQTLTSFDDDGFTVAIGTAGNNGTNENGTTYVGWSWKAGGTAVLNEDGTIDSQVSANQDAGFSIVTYSGTLSSTGTASVGHGLSSRPEMVIYKSRNVTGGDAGEWAVWHDYLSTDNHILRLQNSDAESNKSGNGDMSSLFTATTFGTNYTSGLNVTGNNYVAYCFHSVDGYSKFGSYEGNGSADGTFVYTGFRPAWIMVKEIDASGFWMIQDNKIYPFNNGDTRSLAANDSGAESTISARGNEMDILSNGFKMRASTGDFNASNTHIYVAFAEAPFKYSLAR